MILKYINSINKEIDFMQEDNPNFFGGDLFNYSWSTDSSTVQFGTRIKRFTKNALNIPLVLRLSGANKKRQLNDLFEISDYDVKNELPGRLVFNDYYINGFITSVKVPSQVALGGDTKVDVIIHCPYPFWMKETTTSFNISTTGVFGKKNLDYPHDYAFDYTTSLNVFTLNNGGYSAADFRFVFYGPVKNPSINIGLNTYKVNAEVGARELLMIDSLKKTIVLVKRNGDKQNLFNARYRESYIFEKVPVGLNNVSWSDDFKFDITLIEQRSEPKWI